MILEQCTSIFSPKSRMVRAGEKSRHGCALFHNLLRFTAPRGLYLVNTDVEAARLRLGTAPARLRLSGSVLALNISHTRFISLLPSGSGSRHTPWGYFLQLRHFTASKMWRVRRAMLEAGAPARCAGHGCRPLFMGTPDFYSGLLGARSRFFSDAEAWQTQLIPWGPHFQ